MVREACLSPAELNLGLTQLQLARREAMGARVLMWTNIQPADDSGRSFTCHVRFERGPPARVDFTLDAPIDLRDDSWEARLDHAIFAKPRWLH
jgi:hypothetical protein